ncbi:MAG: hypothetical protein AAF202_07525, partial [Pseudomonadota bacterium]
MGGFKKFEKMAADIKIRVGVGYIIKALVASCLVFLLAVLCIREGFKTYRSTAISTNLYGRTQANILAARLAAMKFLRLNDERFVIDVQERIATLENVSKELMQHHSHDANLIADIKVTAQDQQEYKHAFEKVVG